MSSKNKKTTLFVDNINKYKNIFLSKIKILKNQKEYTGKMDISTIKKVFNIKSKDKKNKNEKIDSISKKDKPKEEKNKVNKIEIINIFIIIGMLLLNSFASVTLFKINDNAKFNRVNEQLTSIIYRSIKSPNTEVFLKSKYDKNTNSLNYYYQVVDKLDSYTYNLSNKDIDNDLKLKLLNNIVLNSKEVNNIKNINAKYESITLVDNYYIINSKYKIKKENISDNEIKLIAENIKNKKIQSYNTNKIITIVSTFALCTLFELLLISSTTKQRKKSTS